MLASSISHVHKERDETFILPPRRRLGPLPPVLSFAFRT